jgi:hypothetical protein
MKFVNRIKAFFRPSIEESREKAEKYLRKEGVIGVATGNKIKAGCTTNTPAITFIVKEKISEWQLMSTEVLPKEIDGHETDVIEVGGDILPMAKKKHRPVKGGVSGMTRGLTACTLGLIVFKDGMPHALTNQHCVTSSDLKEDNIGKKWLQPSPLDGGKAPDAIGTIENPNCLKENEVNPIDSHIIPLSAPHELTVHGYGSYPKRWVEPKIGRRFTKVGRTTGKTMGTISHVGATATVRFGDKYLKFYPCFFARQNNWDIVNGGDSGSVVLCEDGVLGQTFAAGPNLAIFLYGTVIAQELGISLAPPREGFVALGSWMNFNGTEIILRAPTNLRSSPGISDNAIEVLPANTRLTILDWGEIKDGYLWVAVDAQEN